MADIFIHGCNELYHGWKIYDYLIYTRYRFLQRETRWKGLEDSLDECIDESMRTIDQMCFSSQYVGSKVGLGLVWLASLRPNWARRPALV